MAPQRMQRETMMSSFTVLGRRSKFPRFIPRAERHGGCIQDRAIRATVYRDSTCRETSRHGWMVAVEIETGITARDLLYRPHRAPLGLLKCFGITHGEDLAGGAAMHRVSE